ncbi:MAG: NAD-glutamate dehydrogenase [Betaproteobacteria bacterium]
MDNAADGRVDAVLALIAARADAAQRASAQTLARELFAEADPDDLAARSAEDLAGAVLSQWQWGAQRKPATAKVRVISPTVAEHGWAARHTVIQIVNDDMPFLVDSTVMELNRQGLTLHLILHPIFGVQRDGAGGLVSLAPRAQAPDAPRESWIHLEVDRLIDAESRARLAAALERVLADVRAATGDYKAMIARLREAIAELAAAPAAVPREEAHETRAFLQWLSEDHMTLLGYRRHDLVEQDGVDALRLVPGSGLGVLRETESLRGSRRERPEAAPSSAPVQTGAASSAGAGSAHAVDSLSSSESERAASASFAALPAGARAQARQASPVAIVTKANTRSTVHRPGYTDYIGIKRFDGEGRVIGEHRFVGLLTATAYSARVAEIPLVRGKAAAVKARAGLAPGSHSARSLDHVLETYPRDELFQIPVDELYDNALAILQLGERQRLRVFTRRDPFERFVSCLVYAPRESYSTELRLKFQQILLEAFNGSHADFDVLLSDASLARIHFTVRTAQGAVAQVERHALEAKLAAAARRWDDELRDALVDALGEARGLLLFKRWAQAFPVAYRERVSARAAVADVERIDALTPEAPLALSLYRPLGAAADAWGFKVYRLGGPVVLSDSLPMLEHMGVRVLGENNYRIEVKLPAAGGDASAQHPRPHPGPPPQAGEGREAPDAAHEGGLLPPPPAGEGGGGGGAAVTAIALHDFRLVARASDDIEPEQLARQFEDCFARVFRAEVDNDDFNRLVLRAGLSADEIVILRAYAKYLKQIGFALSQAGIEAALAAQPHIAHMLVRLFMLRFDPANRDAAAAAEQVRAIEAALDRVTSLSDDRALRQLLALIQATLRTNFWRTGTGHSGAAGPRRAFVSFKFDSARIPGLPEPRPLYEISVYSPRFEGIHLRGGKVARGGLRWSDRPEDFRTEVLGLVKAQMVKNTVIVPVGSKGGFVLKKAPLATEREAFMKEGVACYQDYLRGLLDLTDNLVAGKVVPPPQVVRHDGDDPYLVVAADKGTATFSDYANAISAEYGHWLGDAFASGGSVGYDHKAMGITARGAWESVKRHFRELGLNTQTTEFTVVGIGDMSGDVFGNGMLLSRHIRLVAAFDHRHVFLDPAPDAPASFAERERLFALPRSSWADYDTKLISAGGGVWSRAEKSIPVSPQMAAVLGIAPGRLAPTELMSAILKAPVDLLYNGGIGTYVKASAESHAQVGDRANDALRIDGRDLRCKVVAEGGNLGFTQRGRIEAALAGVRINTDAIDNSAGVDTSDHEVNIKILLGLAIADGELTDKQRNTLLAEMTDEVAALVLRDNIFQTQSLSLAGRMGLRLIDQQARFIRFLEKRGLLNRAIEFLPSDEELAERKARGMALTSPERAVLLAYSKMWLYEELLASDLPEEPWIGTALERYFPAPLRSRFAGYIARHPLKREIVATHVLNSMVNRVGTTFVHRMAEMTGATAAQIVRAYLATREVFGFVPLWQRIEALDNQVPDATQAEMLIELGRLTTRATTWFLRSKRLTDPLPQTIERFAPAVAALLATAAGTARAEPWQQAGVPADLARHVAASSTLVAALDAAEIAEASGQPLPLVAAVQSGVAERLGLARLRERVDALASDSYWQSLAKAALGDDLAGLQRAIVQDAVAGADGDPAARLAAWEQRQRAALDRAQKLSAEFTDAKVVDLAMLSVALRELRNLA